MKTEADAASTTEIDLSWNLNTIGAQAIEVDRSEDGTTYAAVTTTLPGTALSFADTGLSENTHYYYKVRAILPDSSTSAFSLPADAFTLAAVTGLTSTAASASEIDLSWSLNITNATAIEIDDSTDGGTTWTALITTLSPTATTYNNTGLSEGTHYYYRVHAITAGGTSEEPAATDATTLAAVDSLSASAASTSEIDLSWNLNVADATAVEIDRSNDGGTTWATVTTALAPSNTTYADTGLADNTDYTYQVRAIRPGGASAFTAPADATTVADISALAATAMSTGEIDLAWTLNVTDQTMLSIYRSTDGGAYSLFTDSALSMTLTSTSTTFSDTTVSEGHDYSYELQATLPAGLSTMSGSADALTSPIQNLDYTPGMTSQVLTWSNLSTSGTAIEIDRSNDGTTYSAIAMGLSGSAATYTDTTVSENTEYWYKVKITEPTGTTTTAVLDTWTLPAAPTGLTSTNTTQREVDLTWTNPGVSTTPFFIERSDDGGTTYSIIDETAAGATSYQDTTITDGGSYTYQVDAVSGDGFNDNPTTFTVSVMAPLAAPTELIVTPNGQTEIDLSWSNSSQSATGYEVERSTDGTSFSYIGSVSYADTTSYSDTTAVAGTQYHYRVRTQDASSNQSDPSNVAMIATAPTIAFSSYNPPTVQEGNAYTLYTNVSFATGEVDPVKGWTIDWGDGASTNAAGTANGDPGSFAHMYATTGFYTITASTIDGAFSATQNVEVKWDYQGTAHTIALTDPGSTSGPSDPTAGVSYSLSATYSDYAGHHANTWLINWGDGSTIEQFSDSDSSTDGTGSSLLSTDTKTFTHAFPDSPDHTYFPVITAVTDESVYQQTGVLHVHGDVSWSSDTLTAQTSTTDPVAYPTPVDGISDAEAIAPYAPAGNFTVNWGDTTDGSDNTTFSATTDPAVSPSHQYNRAGDYIVTITETPADGSAELIGHAFRGIAAGAPAMAAMSDQVVAAGQALEITESAGAASGDPLFATINYDDGTAPRVVPITGGPIDLTHVDAPSNFVGIEATSGVGTFVDAYNTATAGDMAQQGFLTDAWSVVLDNGESNDLLISSSDGTQNQQAVTLNFPHPAGEALTLTLSSTNPSQNNVWDPTGTKVTASAGNYPAITIAANDPTSTLQYKDGATAGNVTAGILQYTLAGTANLSASTTAFQAEAAAGTGTVPATAPTSKPASQGGWIIKSWLDSGDGSHNVDVTNATRNWLVGEMVDLVALWTGNPADAKNAKFGWVIDGHTLFQYVRKPAVWVPNVGGVSVIARQGSAKAVPLMDQNEAGVGETEQEVRFFWESIDAASEMHDVSLDVPNFGPGGDLSTSQTTHFTVYQPTATVTVVHGAAGLFSDPASKAQFLGLGGSWAGANPVGIKWTTTVVTPAGLAPGKFQYVQLVKPLGDGTDSIGVYKKETNYGQWVLDGSYPYRELQPNLRSAYDGDPKSGYWVTDAGPRFDYDAPGQYSDGVRFNLGWKRLQVAGEYSTNVMYLPPGQDSQCVSLKVINWSSAAVDDVNGDASNFITPQAPADAARNSP